MCVEIFGKSVADQQESDDGFVKFLDHLWWPKTETDSARISTTLKIRLPKDFKIVDRCTCHPDEAPVPCAEKYTFSECKADHLVASLREVSREFS